MREMDLDLPGAQQLRDQKAARFSMSHFAHKVVDRFLVDKKGNNMCDIIDEMYGNKSEGFRLGVVREAQRIYTNRVNGEEI